MKRPERRRFISCKLVGRKLEVGSCLTMDAEDSKGTPEIEKLQKHKNYNNNNVEV